MENKCNKTQHDKTNKKPHRSTLWRRKKKEKMQHEMQQKKVALKQEKTIKLVASGLDTEQAEAVSEFVVENATKEAATLEELLLKTLKEKQQAKHKLFQAVSGGSIKIGHIVIDNPQDLAFLIKALE